MKKFLFAVASATALIFGTTLKPQFATQYKELVDNKETKKILESKNPIKYLSDDLLNKWKLAANLLLSETKADLTFNVVKYERFGKSTDETLASFAQEIKKNVDELYRQASLLVEQYPIYSYKKSLFKSTPRYSDVDKDVARARMKSTLQELDKIAQSSANLKIKGMLDQIKTADDKKQAIVTAGQKEVYRSAADFADKISSLANNLATEVRNLK